MSDQLVPIKVKIGLRPNGQADHPDWTQLPMVQASGLGHNYKPGKRGGGWHYDKCGHQKSLPDSPYGVQYGMLLVAEEFAQEAAQHMPDIVTIMTETEAEEFYETKVTADLSEYRRDVDTLAGLKTELELLEAIGEGTSQRVTDLKAKIGKAIDPDDPEPGIARVARKTWTGFKAELNVTTKEAEK